MRYVTKRLKNFYNLLMETFVDNEEPVPKNTILCVLILEDIFIASANTQGPSKWFTIYVISHTQEHTSRSCIASSVG